MLSLFGNDRWNKREENIYGILLYGHGQQPVRGQTFSDTPVSIPQIMRGTQRQFSDETIGIVCPGYAGEPPKMVKQFLREIIEANGNQS